MRLCLISDTTFPMREREQERDRPECPNCGQLMRLNHAQPSSGGLPGLKSYRCFFCNEVLTEAEGNE